MTELSEEVAAAKAVCGRIAWGTYDQIFNVGAEITQKFNVQDEHETAIEVADFDPKRYHTIHPVKLVCIATGRFLLTEKLDEAFSRLAAGELPKGSRSEDDVKRQSYRDGVHHSYSLPFDQYSAEMQAFLSGIYRTLYAQASRVWRLLRWRSDAIGSHEIFQTVLSSEWSRDTRATWQ